MDQQKPTSFQNFTRISRPLTLLAGILLYALGTGVVQFLGYPIDWQTYWIGQAAITFLQLSSYYLKVYYDPIPPGENNSPVENKETTPRSMQDGSKISQLLVLQLALVLMTVGAVLTVLLLANGSIYLPAFLLLGIAFLLAFFYAVPPLRLVDNGYGELVEAFLMANLVPALSYLFQTGDLHRILAMLTFPLTALYLAASLAISLERYAADVRSDRKRLMVRMGWQRGMSLHNFLILAAYLLFALAAMLGLPWVLTWPALLTMPLGIFQIWQMSQIAAGAKPRWRLLSLTAFATLGVTIYFLNLALWTY